MIIDRNKILSIFDSSKYTIKGVGIFRKVGEATMLVDVNNDNEAIGIDDSVNIGYIRLTGDATIRELTEFSCSRSIEVTTPLALVVIHNQKDINVTALEISKMLLSNSDISIVSIDLDKEKIEKAEFIKKNIFELVKINFRYKEIHNTDDCITSNNCVC